MLMLVDSLPPCVVVTVILLLSTATGSELLTLHTKERGLGASVVFSAEQLRTAVSPAVTVRDAGLSVRMTPVNNTCKRWVGSSPQ